MTKNRHFTIKNQLLELTRLQTTLEDFFAQHDLSAEVAGEMMLVSEELLVNTISYGYQDELEHVIDIKLSIQDDRFTMTLIDDGQAFNPLDQQAPTMGQPAAEVAIGLITDCVTTAEKWLSNSARLINFILFFL